MYPYNDAIRLAAQIGIKPNEYLDMTAREFQMCLEAYSKNEEKEVINIVTNAWLSAMWQRSEKIPELKTVLDSISNAGRSVKKQTDEDMLEQAQFLNTMFGGTLNIA